MASRVDADERLKAKRRAYMRAYMQQPEVKAKQRAYVRERYAEERRLIALARELRLDRTEVQQRSA